MKISGEKDNKTCTPIVPSVGKDTKAKDNLVSPNSLMRIAWGIGLQCNPHGSFIAFHWGDNRSGRNFAAINLTTKMEVMSHQ
ncbi:hypothetical protein [Legionella sainthelensi]|uniref:hypothetical protein n=1 Tax=Legionella sainthelensi TaxID=28087 RepID=UPI00135C6456|nr:hypothetical protein [Legionella sainthelensi]